ncbi:hypothetical protein V1511DRAFT_461718 [Dipodascopsis uninucleata]
MPSKRKRTRQTPLHKLFTVLRDEDSFGVLDEAVIARQAPSPKRTRAAEKSPMEYASSSLPPISITEKYTSGGYDDVIDPQVLLDDLRVVVETLLSSLSPASSRYKNLDRFYFYATSLVVRLRQEEGLLSEEKTTLENIDLRSNDKEVLYMVSQHGPLFSSLSKKSRLDKRRFPVPMFFNTTKIVPAQPALVPARKLGFLSPSPFYSAIGTAPVVATKLRPMLSDFTHPINAPLPTAKWLRYDPYSSFAPTRDEGHSIISAKAVSAVWYQKFRSQLLRQQYMDTQRASSEDGETNTDDQSPGSVTDDAESSTIPNTMTVDNFADDEENATLDPALIEEWIMSDSGAAFDSASISQISEWLDRLQELQNERFSQPLSTASIASGSMANPTDEEQNIVADVVSTLSNLVTQVPPYVFADLVSRWLPTLSRCTVGSLPPDPSDIHHPPIVHAQPPAPLVQTRRRR